MSGVPSFFNKVSQVSQSELIDFLGHNQSELVVKIAGQYIKTNVNALKSNKYLSLLKFSHFNFKNEPITCLFSIKEEVYFFKSFLNNTNTDYAIDFPADIYQLQRRNDYRVSIPVGLYYASEIRNLNGQSKKIKIEIRDISLGGCQLLINKNSDEFKSGDLIDISIKLDRFEFTQLAMTIKHVKEVESQNYSLIGASFTDMPGATVSEMQALLMYLDRIHRGKTLD